MENHLTWALISCGGLLRDSDGHWLKGFPQRFGAYDALYAEMWGVYMARKHEFSCLCRKWFKASDWYGNKELQAERKHHNLSS
jgi:hypothetical protein